MHPRAGAEQYPPSCDAQVHPSSVKIASVARPDGLVLVSDAIVALGLPDGEHRFGDVGRIDVKGGDKAYQAGTTTLAGAVVALDECMRRFRTFTGCTSAQALEAASLHPAQALGLESSKGSLHVGADADLILLDDSLNVHRCYVGGEIAWSADDDVSLQDEEMFLPPAGLMMSKIERSRLCCIEQEGEEEGGGRGGGDRKKGSGGVGRLPARANKRKQR